MATYSWLAIVTFGAPNLTYRKVWKTDEAQDALQAASRLVGSGSCMDVRIVCCETRSAARKADISDCNAKGAR